MTEGLYIHVPLCISKCTYCDFYKVTQKQWVGDDAFLEALELELIGLPHAFKPKTIFIGGGTPTALSSMSMKKLLHSIAEHVDLSAVSEFTSEANPRSLTDEMCEVLRVGGVNRLSLGVQSFQSAALHLLGRNHTAQVAEEAYYRAREAGFSSVNIDLIQSIPGLTPQHRKREIDHLLELMPDHVSIYNLIYEKGTPLYKKKLEGQLQDLTDDDEADTFEFIKASMVKAGYEHYEISNFTKPGHACAHNINYWKGGDYLGCGPSAHSHWQGERYANVHDLEHYCTRLKEGVAIKSFSERLADKAKARETFVMWLRLTEGVHVEEFEEWTGYNVCKLYGHELDNLIQQGLLEWVGTQLRIPIEHQFISDAIFSELV